MPRKVFITLVSEQSIPNVQYIKEFQPIDAYLFVSTPFTESKNGANAIIAACNLDHNAVANVIVNEESLIDIQQKINETLAQNPIFNATDQYIINCTLGNKIMAIALYEIFKDNAKAQILYTPIGKNKYKAIGGSEDETLFKQKITIKEYFKSYNIGIRKQGQCKYSFESTQYIFNQFLQFKDTDFKILEQLRERESEAKKIIGREKGVSNISDIDGLETFLGTIKFKNKDKDKLSKYEVIYLTGGWFEEWTYYQIKTNFNVDDNQIAIGLESQNFANNDLDVVFIKNNALYIIECKTLLSADLQQSTLYKSGALVDKFGRSAKSYLVTLSDLSPNGILKEAIDLRARQQNVTVIDKQKVINNFTNNF